MTDLTAMLDNAKSERHTLQRLADNARELGSKSEKGLEAVGWYALARAYDSGIARLNGIISLAEMQVSEQKNTKADVCLKHRCYRPCVACWREEHSLKPKL